jgi:UDP-N-acetyl-D-galactosamine dehydrogenase
MDAPRDAPRKIAVVGLGYVGLPLAVALAHHYAVVGYDLKADRIEALEHGHDATGEVADADLATTAAEFSADPEAMRGADLFIITVPTPVDAAHEPDLSAVRAACRTIGWVMAKGATVVLESTVYPGVTEGVCADDLAAASDLEHGRDFRVGFSPERMNPGDKAHSLAQLTKVVAGDTPETAELLRQVYGKVTGGNVFVARNIRTAEAAKVIENAQRDVNIAFINEVAMIFSKLGLSTYDVLDAARTKWNFLPFTPGLVGGHCIGVDPYYLAHKALAIGHDPEVILAGRKINDAMGGYVAEAVRTRLDGPARVLVLGLTFKENVPDLRNTKVLDIVRALAAAGHDVDVHDACADPAEAQRLYGLTLAGDLAGLSGYDAVIGAVPHRDYAALGAVELERLLKPGGLLADVKGMWRTVTLGDGYRRWSL